jgi:exosortase
LFAAYSLGMAVAHGQVLLAWFNYSRHDMSASHLVLIPFVTCVLVYQNRRAIFASVSTAWREGAGVALAGFALSVVLLLYRSSVGATEGLAVAVSALVVLWIGGFLLIYGRVAFREALFPLAFLVFAIPMPGVLLDGAVAVLKAGSTEAVAGLFSLTGTPYLREAFVFTLPQFAIEIADECSGIRSSIALLLTSLLAGHFFLDRPWAKLLLVLVIVPITILKNGIRIVSLSLLAIHVNPAFLEGQLQREGGVVFFLMALGMLAPAFVLLRRVEARPSVQLQPGHVGSA